MIINELETRIKVEFMIIKLTKLVTLGHFGNLIITPTNWRLVFNILLI